MLTLRESRVRFTISLGVANWATRGVQEHRAAHACFGLELLLLLAQGFEARLLGVLDGIRPRLLRLQLVVLGDLETLQLWCKHSCGEGILCAVWEVPILRFQRLVPSVWVRRLV